MKIREITTEELVDKLSRDDQFKLVMTYHEWAFKSKRIPGSLNIHSEESAAELIKPSDEIVVYCVNRQCAASITAYHILETKGFTNLWRYAGGLEEWESAGLVLEGDAVDQTIKIDDTFLR
jgi:rhodanese-related sulfurtransferase